MVHGVAGRHGPGSGVQKCSVCVHTHAHGVLLTAFFPHLSPEGCSHVVRRHTITHHGRWQAGMSRHVGKGQNFSSRLKVSMWEGMSNGSGHFVIFQVVQDFI